MKPLASLTAAATFLTVLTLILWGTPGGVACAVVTLLCIGSEAWVGASAWRERRRRRRLIADDGDGSPR